MLTIKGGIIAEPRAEIPVLIKVRSVELNPNFHEKKSTIPTASNLPMNTPIGLKFICVCRMEKKNFV
ncbi:hypothetical protein OMD49_18505 [Bacillus anthracis]|nr:hypothetical protein [Bacillus anthracis]